MTSRYTTIVPVSRTVGEVQALLAGHGASAVGLRYDGGEPCGVSFVIATPHGERAFSLPVDVDAVARLLAAQYAEGKLRAHQSKAALLSREHAARVAWRVVRDWLEAQLAIVEAQLVTLEQVMLPYLHVDGDRTLYEVYRERGGKAIEP